jgi:hypothetical protein
LLLDEPIVFFKKKGAIINCRRRCMVVETLAEKHFDLAFRMLHEFDLPGINIGSSLSSLC